MEGARAASLLASREKAAAILDDVEALEAEGVPITAAAAEEAAKAAETLAVAEAMARRQGKPAGKWSRPDNERMSQRDLLEIAGYAAAVTARAVARKAPRLSDEEYDDLRADIVLDLLSYASEREGRDFKGTPKWRTLEGKPDPEVEATIGRSYMAAGCGKTIFYVKAAERALADAAALKGAWRSMAVLFGRRYADARMKAAAAERAAVADMEADPHRARRTRIAEGHAEAAEIVGALRGPLGLDRAMESAAVAALDGLTHRERAARLGCTPEAAKQAAKHGRSKLRASLESPDNVRAAMEVARRIDSGRYQLEPDLQREVYREIELDRMVSLCEQAPVDNPAKHRLPGNSPRWRTTPAKPAPVHVSMQRIAP
jgi:hypothetical protein